MRETPKKNNKENDLPTERNQKSKRWTLFPWFVCAFKCVTFKLKPYIIFIAPIVCFENISQKHNSAAFV